jgi:ATP-dependent RNA helicase DDX52/ROK1
LKKKKKKVAKSKQDLLKIHQEKVNRFRNIHKIHVKGADVPSPIDKWEKLKENYGVPEDLLAVLKDSYPTPSAVQMQAIPLMLERRETLVCAPTGSGKTVAFLLPLIHHLREPRNKKGFRAVIVAPTRELVAQIYRECLKLCKPRQLRPFMIDNAAKSAKKISGQKLDILVTTPNRLVYMINNEEISLKNVEWLIVDESDKLFENVGKGGSFRDQLATIYRACSEADVQVRRAFFSATLAPDVEEWCNLNLDNVASVTIGERHAATDTIKQTLVYTGTEKGKLLAFRQLIESGGLKPPVLIFVQEKERAKELFTELIKEKIHVDVIHSERSQLQRDNTVRAFRAGQVWVLICTELMGRGIDFKAQ